MFNMHFCYTQLSLFRGSFFQSFTICLFTFFFHLFRKLFRFFTDPIIAAYSVQFMKSTSRYKKNVGLFNNNKKTNRIFTILSGETVSFSYFCHWHWTFSTETLRKYPITATLNRVATKSYKVDEILTIPVNTTVLINVIAMQLSPKYYSDPMKFDPERFDGTEDCVFMAFGEGPRKCIGEMPFINVYNATAFISSAIFWSPNANFPA